MEHMVAQQIQPVPSGYIPYTEVPSGPIYMPMWVLPNKK